ncbi:MAG: lysophospholipid acyltransferase family protein [Deltaproteobacteria bacterium]|nr:lysophospholipid acyltransferase family protein [Deltaproteobacteria bacterium]MBW2497533.1 lysophospholipid acyltransferase family protein [Deltaproteobacteria bacterium]
MSEVGTTLAERAIALVLAGLISLTNRLAPDRVLALGASFGRLWLRLAAPRVRRARVQIALAFPERDVAWVEARLRGFFEHLGRGLGELLLLGSRHREGLLERVHVEGLEHLEQAVRASPTGGVLVVSAHLGNWELAAARVADLGIPVSVVYRSRERPTLERALRGLRDAAGQRAADFEQIRMGRAGVGLVRALRGGRVVIVLLDQNARRAEGVVFVSFFGRPASTRFGPLRLAARLGVPVVPAFIRREPGGQRHRIRVHPPLRLEPGASDDEEALRRSVQRVTAVIEKEVREVPEQWIWTHARWRTRPRASQSSDAGPS